MPAQYPSQFIPRRPLLGLAACCILGIAFGVCVSGFAPRTLFLSAVSALMLSLAGNWAERCLPVFAPPSAFSRLSSAFRPLRAVVWRPSSGVCSALSLFSLHLAILLTAWFTVALSLHAPSGRELAALMDQPREGVELSGVIMDDPFLRVARDGTRRTWDFPLRVEAIHRLSSWQTARGTVQVSLRDQPGSRSPHYGERWRLAGVLVDNARFPDLPSFAKLPRGLPRGASRPVLEWIKNRHSFAADPASGVCLAEDQGVPLKAWCLQGRRKAANCLTLGIEHRPEVVGLLQALLLGYRQELPDKLRSDFIATGTYHIFAISGQHVAILALFIIVVLQAQRVCRVKWFLYVAPVLIVFTLSTGLSSSAVRGCLMALLVFLGPLLHRKTDLPSAMALAAILILAVDPFQLFDYGFLLSFGVVAGLIVFCPPILKSVEPWLMPDPWRLEPERPSVQFWRNIVRFGALLLVSSLAAWAVSTPLIARWFNLVSPVALLANLIVIPVSTLVLLAGCLAILCGLCLPWLGEVFNFANVVLVSFLLFVTDLMARIPWGHFFVASPPVWAVLVWFGSLLAWLPGWGLHSGWGRHLGWGRRRLWLLGPVILVVAFLGNVILNWNRVTADIINIGEIPVCLIKAPGTAPMLVHAGSRFYGRRVAQKLRQQGVDRLSALVLPAADEHHAGGALDILATFRVKEIWCVTTNSRSPFFQQVLATARDRSVPVRVLSNGAWGAWRGNIDCQYQAGSNKFLVKCSDTAIKIAWGRNLGRGLHPGRGRAMPGQDSPDMVTVEHQTPPGMPLTLHIRCVEPGEVMPDTGSANGISAIGLTPGQGARVFLTESDFRVEPLKNR
ncbi:MAG: ComEC/Rec2 family competence protein [Kiritimatiellae bacterium]|nr:ComEC/Rec2 family competence protein [Kiritimatiellia bacterium]